MFALIGKLIGKNFVGYAIMTPLCGREYQSGPTYATRSEAANAFVARRFSTAKGDRIKPMFV